MLTWRMGEEVHRRPGRSRKGGIALLGSWPAWPAWLGEEVHANEKAPHFKCGAWLVDLVSRREIATTAWVWEQASVGRVAWPARREFEPGERPPGSSVSLEL